MLLSQGEKKNYLLKSILVLDIMSAKNIRWRKKYNFGSYVSNHKSIKIWIITIWELLTKNYINRRDKRGDKNKYLKVLAKVKEVAPEEQDK